MAILTCYSYEVFTTDQRSRTCGTHGSPLPIEFFEHARVRDQTLDHLVKRSNSITT
jgi:hypothetical protein